ncbi:MAG: glycosyltransferase [Gemmatimonadota bacterium]|jgi:succinoglycan biosynthesis protein ExoW|nr:glycosyltransferase [Gemmatimonadota bacterium]
MSGSIAVIIPYYQREPGLLRRALDSIAAQVGIERVVVLVVDDESPLPPDDEIRASVIANDAVVVLRQANSGPGIARNTGLDNLPDDCEFIAFLDSDDYWAPGHLLNATTVLGEDLDFYFSNTLFEDFEQDTFTRSGRLDPQSCSPLGRGSNAFRYVGDMLDQVVRACIIETSTVVYRRERFGHHRFNLRFRSSCEDHLLWLAIANEGCRFVFTTDVELHSGRGVSIYKSMGMGSDTLMPALIDQYRYYREIEEMCSSSPVLRQVNLERITEIRTSVVADVLHRLVRHLPIDRSRLRSYITQDPALLVLALPLALKVFLRRKKAHRLMDES